MPDWKFLEGVVRLNWVEKWLAAWERLKTTDLELQTSKLCTLPI